MATSNKNKTSRTRHAVRDAASESVQRLYDRSAPLLIGESVLFIIGAALMLFRPVSILTALTFVIGIGLVLFGLYRTIAGFVVSRPAGGGWIDVLFGLVNIVLGVLFCVYPMSSMISLVYIFVVLFLFKALRALIFAINMARAKFGHYVLDLILAIILVGLAVFLLFYPVAGAVAMIYYLAITLVLYAAADIYMYMELRRLKKQITQ